MPNTVLNTIQKVLSEIPEIVAVDEEILKKYLEKSTSTAPTEKIGYIDKARNIFWNIKETEKVSSGNATQLIVALSQLKLLKLQQNKLYAI